MNIFLNQSRTFGYDKVDILNHRNCDIGNLDEKSKEFFKQEIFQQQNPSDQLILLFQENAKAHIHSPL